MKQVCRAKNLNNRTFTLGRSGKLISDVSEDDDLVRRKLTILTRRVRVGYRSPDNIPLAVTSAGAVVPVNSLKRWDFG